MRVTGSPAANCSSARISRARWRHSVKLKPVSAVKRRAGGAAEIHAAVPDIGGAESDKGTQLFRAFPEVVLAEQCRVPLPRLAEFADLRQRAGTMDLELRRDAEHALDGPVAVEEVGGVEAEGVGIANAGAGARQHARHRRGQRERLARILRREMEPAGADLPVTGLLRHRAARTARSDGRQHERLSLETSHEDAPGLFAGSAWTCKQHDWFTWRRHVLSRPCHTRPSPSACRRAARARRNT
ncbi:hypothetical protein E5CHR_01254 [Variovorax sp. PBL-E5]|nr:hypothetical protein E5CHR_01254 [Variovorax sp. PBL-E5]